MSMALPATGTDFATHPLDQATELLPAGEGEFTGLTHPLYWNMVGPYGGVTAATMMKAVMQHPARLGEPVALTVNFAGPVGRGPFTVRARAARTNRSNQHWLVEQLQTDAQGRAETVTTASAVTALRRETFNLVDHAMPDVPAPETIAPLRFRGGPEWFQCYDLRPVSGAVPRVWDGGNAGDSISRLWMRDQPARPLDYVSLAALCDFFFPRIWRRRAIRMPTGTVSMTSYFHTDAPQLAETGTDFLLGQARGQAFYNGYFDQTAQLWNRAGDLLVTTHQTVYFKE
jgi:acyl-CoA thioesterase